MTDYLGKIYYFFYKYTQYNLSNFIVPTSYGVILYCFFVHNNVITQRKTVHFLRKEFDIITT